MTRPLPIPRIFSQHLGLMVAGEWPANRATVTELPRDERLAA